MIRLSNIIFGSSPPPRACTRFLVFFSTLSNFRNSLISFNAIQYKKEIINGHPALQCQQSWLFQLPFLFPIHLQIQATNPDRSERQFWNLGASSCQQQSKLVVISNDWGESSKAAKKLWKYSILNECDSPPVTWSNLTNPFLLKVGSPRFRRILSLQPIEQDNYCNAKGIRQYQVKAGKIEDHRFWLISRLVVVNDFLFVLHDC